MNGHHIKIGLAGDVMLGRGVHTAISENGSLYPWGNLLPVLKTSDINIVNLENAFTHYNRKAPKTFNFKATPDKVDTLLGAEISLVNLANNHVLDFGKEGLIETLSTLKEAGIAYAGAGLNRAEAIRPRVLVKNSLAVGVVGFTDNEPDWKAGEAEPGTNYIDISSGVDRKFAVKSIADLYRHSDIVIVSIHWGPNMNLYPEPGFISFAHEMIDAGADIIHGHSAHNFQGIELYKGKLILYDTGDFVDDYAVHENYRNDHSFYFQVTAARHLIQKLALVPVLIRDCQVNLATGKDREWCLDRIQLLSERFGTRFGKSAELIIS
ncbi:CapA family protein [Flavihumibacter stibioxidans]|uniref:Capsule synthesis protein CapA domain-containing protein n=1 Tax=Flavihumibacter stibioxidans TaxID=1834163 RepID=A0ABR7M524_9BACT|nr:CapA family protein [Flavihumibacter stibioxidans]MBC6490108.1 hypothetical protein [Flavihumibacter stibioxidans]